MNPDKHVIYDFMRSRHSVRQFQDKPVPQGAVMRMLEMACLAPSAHNRQPWRFVVLGQGETRRKLVEAMGAKYREDMEADGLQPETVETRLRRSQERLLGAPLAILLCLTMQDMDTYPDARRNQAEREMAIQSASLAGGHLLLAAHAEGLGGCWTCAPLFAPEVVSKTLELPEDWEPQACILLGVPIAPGEASERKPVDEVTLWG
jgi:F420 biosynthesis protein FbiB-like protein